MSFICENCKKNISTGATQRHGRGVAGKRWNKRAPLTLRLFRPNIQKVAITQNGRRVSMELCAKCLKRMKKEGKLKYYTSAAAS